MEYTSVARRSVADQVFDQMLEGVITGDTAPGEPLPGERRLAEVFGVSRPVVREALGRMAHTGLLRVRHGGTTTVLDFHRHAGMDLLPKLLVRGGRLDAAVALDVVEARTRIGPVLAADAATNWTPDLAAELESCLARLQVLDDSLSWQRAVLDYWDVIVDGTGSIVYRLMFNTLRGVFEPALEALAEVLADEVGRLEPYRALAAAIDDHDPETAAAQAQRVLAVTHDSLAAALATLTDLTDRP